MSIKTWVSLLTLATKNIESLQIWIRRVRVRVMVETGETNIESEKIWIRRVRVRVRVRIKT